MEERDSRVFAQELMYFKCGTKMETSSLTNIGDVGNM